MSALTQRERAVELLRELFLVYPQGIERRKALDLGRINNISARTMERAKTELGAKTKHNGSRPGFWLPPR